ncbi:hypothetical protein INR49_018449, partial [Caranx melampygus]
RHAAILTSRPQTGLSFLASEPEDLEDLYSRYKKLQQELEFLEVQEEYIKDEQKNLKKEFLHAQEEVKRIQSIPLVIGQFLEAVDQNTAIVGSTTASKEMHLPSNSHLVQLLCAHPEHDRQRAAETQRLSGFAQAQQCPVDVLPPEADSSIMMLTSDQKPDVMYADIGGMDIQKQEVREAVELPLTHFELYKQIGIDPPRGVLMYGPPGCGKTMLAKAVAHHTTADRKCRESYLSCLIKWTALTRMSMSSIGNGPKVIMATNRADTLDPALLRPGRLDRKIEFPLPDRRQKRLIFSTITSKMNLSEEVDLEDCILLCPMEHVLKDNEASLFAVVLQQLMAYVARPDKISGADINSICQEAGMLAVRENRYIVLAKDFEKAYKTVIKKDEQEHDPIFRNKQHVMHLVFMECDMSKWRYLFMFLGIQLVVMALLSREGYQKRVTYFIRIFRKPDGPGFSSRNHTAAGITGGDVYANLSHLSKAHSHGDDMPFCPKTSPFVGGPIHVSFPSGLTLAEVQRKNPLVVRGGRYRPPDCEARHRTAIVIPHRHREHHLRFLLYYLHPFLQRQQLNYGIYVIHQAGNYTFNRAKLMNVGFREAMREEDWDCLFFHDVDLIPEDDRNTYMCDSNPKHAAIAMDKFGYKLPYKMYFGGVSALTPLHYLKMNGFPNNYWGWGGEDDDIGVRDVYHSAVTEGWPLQDDKHKLDKGNDVNPKRFNMLAKTRQTWKLDGMNTAEYEIISREYLPLYTNITVNIGTEAGLHPPTRHLLLLNLSKLQANLQPKHQLRSR